MKVFLLRVIAAVLAGSHCVLGVIRTEELVDGVVHITFSNFTDTDTILNETGAVARRQRPNAFKFVECRNDDRTYWDYWWYGVGPILVCGKNQKCSIARGEGKTVGMSIGGNGGMDFPKLYDFAFKFNAAYTYSWSTTTTVTQTINWEGPTESRLWLKQWFAVTEATCRSCYGSNPGAPDYYCNAWAWNKGWIPCSDGNCSEYSVSDAYGRCDAGNNCQLN